MTNIEKYQRFMLESNSLAREERLNPGDVTAVMYALNTCHWSRERLLLCHEMLGSYLHENWVGRLRQCDSLTPPSAPRSFCVPAILDSYIQELPAMDSWSAHNQFVYIRPFYDLNGRVGRLIWLSKAISEGYTFNMPFLYMYYHQTLRKKV